MLNCYCSTGRGPGRIVLSRDDRKVEYELLATVPFDSTRKRMSTVVRTPTGDVVVYSKGADNIMFDRCTQFVDLQPNASPRGKSPFLT
jgi:phospholipid-transporting ATPase